MGIAPVTGISLDTEISAATYLAAVMSIFGVMDTSETAGNTVRATRFRLFRLFRLQAVTCISAGIWMTMTDSGGLALAAGRARTQLERDFP